MGVFKSGLLFLCVLCTVITVVTSHSWIACTDYLEMTGDYWDSSKCRAYPRHGHQYTPKENFGLDRGYNIINPPEDAPCRTQRGDQQAYNDDYPVAVYFRGQTVVIAHPTKNHVADVGCTNKYIPDNGNFIWRGPVNVSADVTLTQFRSNVVADLGIAPTGYLTDDARTRQYPKPGYQNAPKFCENTDKSLATNEFVIPENIQTGRYTFMWGWYFNSPMDLYTSCWEVDIVATRTERDNRLRDRGQTTSDPVNTGGDMNPAPTPAPTPGPARTSPGQPAASTTSSAASTSSEPGQCDCQCPQQAASSAPGAIHQPAMLRYVIALLALVWQAHRL